MLHFICRSCLRLWAEERVHNRSACPSCNGALTSR
jgi:hypothetical protein